jgi:mannonate dehydratase
MGATQEDLIDEYDDRNTKICHAVRWNESDEYLLYLKQIGLRWVSVGFPSQDSSLEAIGKVNQRFRSLGLEIYSAQHLAYRSLQIQLGKSGRDKQIETYCNFIRHIGKLGIPVSNYDFHPANTYTTAMVSSRRGYITREFNLQDFRSKVEKQRFEREYSAKEMWEKYTFFVEAVLPVAEEANVKLALHPDDPPLAYMNGVAKLIVDYDGYRRAEEIAGGSKNWGILLCVGTWAEGGDQMGKDVFEMIKDFGGRGKIFQVHFRNVSSPLPVFHETFLDDGYLDMYKVMRAFREVRYSGSLLPDHIPHLISDDEHRRAGLAYSIAYMRSFLHRANKELG